MPASKPVTKVKTFICFECPRHKNW